jgi:hypothetical protein
MAGRCREWFIGGESEVMETKGTYWRRIGSCYEGDQDSAEPSKKVQCLLLTSRMR